MRHPTAINGATTGGDLLTDIRAAQEAGYDAIEVPDVKLDAYLQGKGTLPALRDRLQEAGLSLLSVGALEQATLLNGGAFGAMIDRCRVLCEWASALSAPFILIVPSPTPPGWTDRAIREKTLASLRAFADIAAQYRVRIGFEFLGFADCSVRTLAATRDLLQEMNSPTIGMVIDSFHFHVGGSRWAELEHLDPAEVLCVHLSDAENRPMTELTDDHRLFPGDGIIALRELIRRLDALGYRGFYSLELFRPEYWKWDPLKLAAMGRRKMEAILAS
jgi:2-keto-myo-inositol isomerase